MGHWRRAARQPDNAPPPVTLCTRVAGSGAPELELPMPAPFTLAGAANEATHEVELPLATVAAARPAARWT